MHPPSGTSENIRMISPARWKGILEAISRRSPWRARCSLCALRKFVKRSGGTTLSLGESLGGLGRTDWLVARNVGLPTCSVGKHGGFHKSWESLIAGWFISWRIPAISGLGVALFQEPSKWSSLHFLEISNDKIRMVEDWPTLTPSTTRFCR